MTLDGRQVLVTGGSSGIGAATARAVARAGALVAVTARRGGALEALADEIGGVAVVGDVTNFESAPQLVNRVADKLGGLDTLINSAGIVRPGLIADTDPAGWKEMFDVNVLGLLTITQAAVPHLRAAGGGAIVNVSSMSGRRVPSPPGGVYAATKFAVHAISESLRKELQSDGIRVTTISPGFVATDLYADLEDSDLVQRYRDRVAEVGLRAQDVAAAIVHALSAPPSVTTVEIALMPTAQS